MTVLPDDRDEVSDLISASTSSLAFWDNTIDDEVWNNALSEDELVPISVPFAKNQLSDSFGIFKDDPYFAEILQEMREERELDDDNPAYT